MSLKQIKNLAFLYIVCFVQSPVAAQELSKEKQQVLNEMDKAMETYSAIAQQIWENAELGFMENKSAQLLQDRLRAEGFKVTVGSAGMPTAFVAEYGKGKPIIALLAEYDALPDMSQRAIPSREIDPARTAGHACGHHMFGAGSLAAAIHTKHWLVKTGSSGTIRLYGTPAEEGGGGKVYMTRAGLFDDVDGVLSWHPSDKNTSNASSTLAAISARFAFKGVAAHASAGPWRGRSALDGVEAMNYMVNLMREHVTPATRIHYAITNGSKAANIVPAAAEVSYVVRHPDMEECKDLFKRVIQAARAGAMGTDTEMTYEIETGYFNKMPNKILAEMMHKNLSIVGGVNYTEDERKFATDIMKSYPSDDLTPESAQKVETFEVIEIGMGGSTDVGDISWVRPTAGLRTATWVPGTVAHSWQAVAAGGTSIGHKGMMVAAKTMTLTAIDLYKQPGKLVEAEKELQERRGADFKYEALLGDREPPLDYRKGIE